jgi:N-acetylneuraminic acid mutarotase
MTLITRIGVGVVGVTMALATAATGAGASGGAPQAVSSSKSFTNLTWKLGAKVPNAHLEGAAVAVGSKVYDISGAASDCSDGVPGPTTADVDIYDPATNTFSAGPAIPDPRQGDPSAVVIGKKIYVVGGDTACNGAAVSQVNVYSVKHASWTTLLTEDLPTQIQGGFGGCAASIGSVIYYFFGGLVGVLNTAKAGPKWSVSDVSALTPTDFCEAATVGQNIYVVSAGDGSTDPFSQRVFKFDPMTRVAKLQSETTVPFAEESIGVIHQEIVMAGGDFEGNKVVQIVVPHEHSVITAANALPDYRDDSMSDAVIGNKVYIVGGQSMSGGTQPPVMIGRPSS